MASGAHTGRAGGARRTDVVPIARARADRCPRACVPRRNAPDSVRLSAPQASSSPTSRCAVGTGMAVPNAPLCGHHVAVRVRMPASGRRSVRDVGSTCCGAVPMRITTCGGLGWESSLSARGQLGTVLRLDGGAVGLQPTWVSTLLAICRSISPQVFGVSAGESMRWEEKVLHGHWFRSVGRGRYLVQSMRASRTIAVSSAI